MRSFEQSFVRSFVQSFCRASCRAFAELRESSVQSSVQKAPQLYAEGWPRGRKRLALVFTAQLGGAEVKLGPLRRRLPLNIAQV